jgi:hypothetical protein
MIALKFVSQINKVSSALCAVIATVVLLTAALNTNAQVVFGAGANYPAGTGPWGVVSGDFNGDGRPDLAVANHGSGTPGTFGNAVNVLLGNAGGTFQSAVSYACGVGPTNLLTADLNRDGKLDLITGNLESNSFSVLLGNGNGTFQAAVDRAVSNRPTSLITADFNHDGNLDVALTVGSAVSVFLGNGTGGLGAGTDYPIAGGSQYLAFGDFNRDGKLDVIASSVQIQSVSVLLGNGDGTFQTMINSATGSNTQPAALVVGDYNRDGKADVAVAFFAPPSINIMLGNGDGSFAAPSYKSKSVNTPVDLKAGDFDGDGKLDLVSTGIFNGPHADVFLGNGDGTLKTSVPFGSGPGAISVTVSDFNNDTRPDLGIVANGQVSVVLLNATPGNPDKTDYFVHQHYLDFLRREPDVSGFDYWTAHLDQCATDPSCTFERRIGTSAAFMVESEFQQTGYFVHRLYKAAYSRRPTYAEFTVDSKKVIGGSQLEVSKTTLVDEFAQSSQFKLAYPDSLSNADFVNRLFDAATLTPFINERQAAVDSLNQGASRAAVLRTVIDNPAIVQREYNAAFVQMQYFGYLRRDEEPDGYQFWLDKLNAQPGNFRGMVCAFITSAEYQHRFSPNATHNNLECGR